MKTASRALALLFLAAGLVADSLFCCTLLGQEQGVSFAAPTMDCPTRSSEKGSGDEQ